MDPIFLQDLMTNVTGLSNNSVYRFRVQATNQLDARSDFSGVTQVRVECVCLNLIPTLILTVTLTPP